jgi:hypothetical protein
LVSKEVKATRKSSSNAHMTPRRELLEPAQGGIPTVSESRLRKPSLIHFTPQGPSNQATSLKTTTCEGLQSMNPELTHPPAHETTLQEQESDDDGAVGGGDESMVYDDDPTVKSVAPVRVKGPIPLANQVAQTEPEVPMKTPASFCTRLDTEAFCFGPIKSNVEQPKAAKINYGKDQVGDESLTLIDDQESCRPQPSPQVRRRQRCRTPSTDAASAAATPTKIISQSIIDKPHAAWGHSVRKSQHDLMSSIVQITKVCL